MKNELIAKKLSKFHFYKLFNNANKQIENIKKLRFKNITFQKREKINIKGNKEGNIDK